MAVDDKDLEEANDLSVAPIVGPDDPRRFTDSRDRDRAAVHGGRRPRRPRRAARPAGRAPLHARPAPRDVPQAAVDDAPVRGLRERQGIKRALPLPAQERLDRPVHGLRPPDPARARLRRPALPRRGRAHRRRDRLARRHADRVRRHPARRGLDLDDHQRPRGRADAALPARRRGAGRRAGAAPRHDAERHPQGVHRPRELHLPARAEHAAGHRPVRLLRRAHPEVEHGVDLRLPLPREGLQRGAGGRVHARQRHGLRAGGARRRAQRRRLRPPPGLLLQRPQQRLPGGREVPRRPQAVGRVHARPLRGREPEVADDPLPHPDRRRDADRPAAGQQHRPRRAAGLRRRLRRHAVAAHQRLRRGARAPRASAPPRSRCARSRSSPTSRAPPTPSTRSPAPTTSRR